MLRSRASRTPSVLIVGGAWHTHHYLGPLAEAFEAAGYPTRSMALPSAGADPPAPDSSMDVSGIRNAATRLLSKRRDLIVVFHGISGIAGTNALRGLVKGGPNGVSHSSGVRAIIYVATMLPARGGSFETHLESLGDLSWKPVKQTYAMDGAVALPDKFAFTMFYDDVDKHEAAHLSTHLQPQSLSVYTTVLQHELYRDIVSGYVILTRDQACMPEYQIETAKRAGFPPHRILTLDTGHIPWLSKPNEVRDFAIRMAEQSEAERIALESSKGSRFGSRASAWLQAQVALR